MVGTIFKKEREKLRYTAVKGLAKVTELGTTKYSRSACCCVPGTTPGLPWPVPELLARQGEASEPGFAGAQKGLYGNSDGLGCVRWGPKVGAPGFWVEGSLGSESD